MTPRKQRKKTDEVQSRTILSVYLLSKDVPTVKDAISSEKRSKKAIVAIGGKSCELHIQPARPNAPRWIRFFGGALRAWEDNLMAASPSAVLFVPINERLFALTFGHGRHLLKPGCWEERFGLKVTLNAVEPQSIRSITKRSFDSLARLVQEQSARAARASDFGLDVERDLLQAVTGTPVDEHFAARLSGADALVASVNIDSNGLPSFLRNCLKYDKSSEYKKEYPWVDQIAAVRSKELVDTLDAQLVSKLRGSGTDRLWLAVPDLIDWTGVAGFTFSASQKAELEPDLHMAAFLSLLKDEAQISVPLLKRRHAFCWSSESEDEVSNKWTVYKCIYCEIDFEGGTYLLNAGKWYRVDQDFVTTVNESVDRIPAPTGIALPTCGHIDEGQYNSALYGSDRSYYALMDKKMVWHGAGRSQVEVCDLLTKDRRLIHIKKYGGSQAMSHLFAQAVVSGELLALDPEFRGKANKHLPKSHQLPKKFTPEDFEIVLGIISWTKKKLSLPFFSKVNLRAAHRRLTGFGYRVSLAAIRGPSSTKDPANLPAAS